MVRHGGMAQAGSLAVDPWPHGHPQCFDCRLRPHGAPTRPNNSGRIRRWATWSRDSSVAAALPAPATVLSAEDPEPARHRRRNHEDRPRPLHRRNSDLRPERPNLVMEITEKAQAAGVQVRVIPDLYDGLATEPPRGIHRPIPQPDAMQSAALQPRPSC